MIFDFEKNSYHTAVLTEDGQTYTYAELNAIGSTITALMQPRRLTFCLCQNSIGSLLGYVGLMAHNIPTVLLDADKDVEMTKKLVACYRPQYIWLPTIKAHQFSDEKPLTTYGDYALLRFDEQDYEIHPDVLLCLTTSGTTGSPKLVKLTEGNLRSNALSIAEYLDITPDERAITSLPMYYSFGMSVINSHFVTGATLLLTDKAVVQREFLNFLKDGKATSIAGVPYTYETLRRLRFLRMELPDLKTMIQAGGKLNASIVKEYVENCRNLDKKFIVMYGQTEAAPRMSYLPFEYAVEKSSSIGIAIPGGKLSVRDDNDVEIQTPYTDGELVYEGPNVCMGYAESIADLAKGDENSGVLHTGDIAHFDNDHYFYITGRMKRFVKIWGNRCNLDAVEQLVKAVTVDCACVGVDDRITVFVTKEGLESNIKNYLCEKTGLNIRAFEVKVIEEIPKLTSGKLNYQSLQGQI